MNNLELLKNPKYTSSDNYMYIMKDMLHTGARHPENKNAAGVFFQLTS